LANTGTPKATRLVTFAVCEKTNAIKEADDRHRLLARAAPLRAELVLQKEKWEVKQVDSGRGNSLVESETVPWLSILGSWIGWQRWRNVASLNLMNTEMLC
jgi:hypothetical protein